MAAAKTIEITQKGIVVDPENFKGPIRLRLVHKADDEEAPIKKT